MTSEGDTSESTHQAELIFKKLKFFTVVGVNNIKAAILHFILYRGENNASAASPSNLYNYSRLNGQVNCFKG